MNARLHSGVSERRFTGARKVSETQLGREAVRETVSKVLIRIHPSDELGQGLLSTLCVFLQKLEIRLEVFGLQIVFLEAGDHGQLRSATLLLRAVGVRPDGLTEPHAEVDDVDELPSSGLLVELQEGDEVFTQKLLVSFERERHRSLDEIVRHGFCPLGWPSILRGQFTEEDDPKSGTRGCYIEQSRNHNREVARSDVVEIDNHQIF